MSIESRRAQAQRASAAAHTFARARPTPARVARQTPVLWWYMKSPRSQSRRSKTRNHTRSDVISTSSSLQQPAQACEVGRARATSYEQRGVTPQSTHRITFGCSISSRIDASRSAVAGTPPLRLPSSSRIRLMTTGCPVATTVAAYTTPNVPAPSRVDTVYLPGIGQARGSAQPAARVPCGRRDECCCRATSMTARV